MQGEVKARAVELLKTGAVDRVLGWKAGAFFYDLSPAVFATAEEVEREFVWSPFSAPNLSKYLIAQSRKPGKIAAFLKPCDTYSFQQLCKEHRVQRAAVYAVAVQCQGMCDIEQIKSQAKAPLAVREAGETLVVETLYGEKRLPGRRCWQSGATAAKPKRWPAMTSFWGRTEPKAERAAWTEYAAWRP